jgi:hypothetical protein
MKRSRQKKKVASWHSLICKQRGDPESPDVCVVANQALADILSLEQGMEEE